MAGLADGDPSPMATSHPPHPQAPAQVLRLPLRWNRARAGTHPRGNRSPRRLREVPRMSNIYQTLRKEIADALINRNRDDLAYLVDGLSDDNIHEGERLMVDEIERTLDSVVTRAKE